MRREISFVGKVGKEDININNPNFFKSKHDEYVKFHKGKHVKVIYKIVESGSPARFHSFYRGVIVPVFAREMSEPGQIVTELEAHMMLKREFMYIALEKGEDVPDEYHGYVKLDIVAIEDKSVIIKGYVKSTAIYSLEEWVHFMKKCKQRLLDMGIGVDGSDYIDVVEKI